MSLSAIENKKYPRTYRVPFSPDTTSDDRLLYDGWFEDYQGKKIVLTKSLRSSIKRTLVINQSQRLKDKKK
jgi:hypothetical protein